MIRITDRAEGKEALDERDRLVRLADECINQRGLAAQRAVKCVFAFWLQFDHDALRMVSSFLCM